MSRLSESQKASFMHWNYAHRGLHSADKKVPENSLAAFRLAREAGYGYELDVQFSSDRKVVVFHDDTLKRVTGVDGRVDSLSYDELSQLHLFNSGETIPLFSEVLKAVNGGGPLIVELKSGPNNDELCNETLKLLRNYSGIYCIESFDPRIVNWFRKNAPDIVRGQLSAPYENMKSDTGEPFISFLLSRCFFSFINKPDFIAYKIGKRPGHVLRMRKKGIMLFGWTARKSPSPEDNDGVIFEHYHPECRF